MQAYREEGGIVPTHLQTGIRSRYVVSTYSGYFTPRKDPIPNAHKGWWAGQSGWQGRYCLNRIQSLDCPAWSDSL